MSPLTETAFSACGETPNFSCSTIGTSITFDPNTKKPNEGCSSAAQTDVDNIKCGDTSTIFVNLAKIKQLTGESKAACMALLGPNVDTTAQTQNAACSTVVGGVCTSDYNPGGLLFNTAENSNFNLGYKKWIDLNCATKTNSIMCGMIGKHS